MLKKVVVVFLMTVAFQTQAFAFDTFKIGSPWSPHIIEELYGGQLSDNLFFEFMNFLQQSPIGVFGAPVKAHYSLKTDGIAAACAVLPDVWARIYCVSDKVNKMVYQATISSGQGNSFYGINCRYYAYTFSKALRSLGEVGIYDNVEVLWIKYDNVPIPLPHVVNVIIHSDRNHNVFSYILDNGFSPNMLYPLNPRTTALLNIQSTPPKP